MTPDPQSQSQETQGPQPDTKTAQGSETQDPQPGTKKTGKIRSWLKRLGVALGDFLLGDLKDQIETKLDEKLDKKIDNIIKLQKIEESATIDMNSKVSETVEKVKKDLQEDIVSGLKKEYNDLKKEYEQLEKKVSKTTMTLIIIGGLVSGLGGILFVMSVPIISDIFSVDVLKSDIETLKEDIEDLRDN